MEKVLLSKRKFRARFPFLDLGSTSYSPRGDFSEIYEKWWRDWIMDLNDTRPSFICIRHIYSFVYQGFQSCDISEIFYRDKVRWEGEGEGWGECMGGPLGEKG